MKMCAGHPRFLEESGPGKLVSAAQFGYAGPWLKNIETFGGRKFLCDHFACPFVIQQEEGKEVP